MQVEHVARLRGRYVLITPDQMSRHPDMHLDARRAGVTFINNVLQCIECARDRRCARIPVWRLWKIEGIAASSHLHDDSVVVIGATVIDQSGHLTGIEEPGSPGIDPNPAKFIGL